MQALAKCFLIVALTHGGGGVTKSGIEKFWTDDYKIFEQVYGKTSDKEIYGETLPPSITFTSNHDITKDASQKNERYLINYNDPDSDQFDSYTFGNHFGNILNQQSLKSLSKKPAISTVNFVSYSNRKPISLESDPETYNYLKHLEELNKEEKYQFPMTVGGFKPYFSSELQETDSYKSIQDILEAQEDDDSSQKEDDSTNVKYLTYPKTKRKKPPRVRSEGNKPRCTGRGCGKRGTNYRSRSRPYRWTPTLKAVVVM